MSWHISGVSIGLVTQVENGKDDFGHPLYTEEVEEVENVLVGLPSAQDIAEASNLTGRQVAYTLAIPKGDTHSWEATDVLLPPPFAGRYHVVGIPSGTIEENTPGPWNLRVMVERHE